MWLYLVMIRGLTFDKEQPQPKGTVPRIAAANSSKANAVGDASKQRFERIRRPLHIPIGVNTGVSGPFPPKHKKGIAEAMPKILAPKSLTLPETGIEPARP